MNDFSAMEQKIREQAKEWLANGEIKYFIGYERGENSGKGRPVFIYHAEDVDRLILDSTCFDNLSRYLVEELKKKTKRGEEPDLTPVGLVVKPCDSKTLIELIKENILPRERVRVIGVTCEGVDDPKENGEQADKCAVCTHHDPLIADLIVGEKLEEDGTDEFEDIKEIEEMSIEERWEYWEKLLSRCVRCYACREACPLCYCEECVFDRFKPYKWNEDSVKLRENLFYHMVRAMHLAGRCIDCGECERACPMDIPIRQLNRFLTKQAKERFDIEAGLDEEDKSMFGTYDIDDPGEEIW